MEKMKLLNTYINNISMREAINNIEDFIKEKKNLIF